MTDQSSVDGILEFLKKNRFSKAEEALRNELNNNNNPSDLNRFLENLSLEDKDSSKGSKPKASSQDSQVSNELIVKEIDCGIGNNGSVIKCGIGEKPSKKVISREMSFTFSENSGDAADARSCKLTTSGKGILDPYRSTDDVSGSSVVDPYSLEQSRHIDKKIVETGEDIVFFGNKTTSWSGNATSKGNSGSTVNEIDRPIEKSYSTRLRTEDVADTTSENLKESSVKTSRGDDASTSYSKVTSSDKRDGKKKAAADINDMRAAIKEQESEVARALFFGKTQSTFDDKNVSSLGFPLVYDARKEEFPRLPPVKLKSEDNPLSLYCEEKFERDGSGSRPISDGESLLIGSYLDVPIGQEISSSGGKKSAGGNWLSVSQGIAEDVDASDLVSGFATIGDGMSESVDYRNEYWDSDEYEDDDDIGYVRQPIEDETWFLSHEIDYPSDHEKATTRGSPDHATKDEDDDQSYAEEASSYISGEQYPLAKVVEPESDRRLTVSEIYPASKKDEMISQYIGELVDEEVLDSISDEPVWQGFEAKKGVNVVHDDQHDSVRSIGVGINSDAADFGSEVRESLAGGSSEGDFEYPRDHHDAVSSSSSRFKRIDGTNKNKQKASEEEDSGGSFHVKKTQTDGGFEFGNQKTVIRDTSTATDDMVATWRRKSSDTSSSSVKEDNAKSRNSSSPSSLSNYACGERKHADKEDDGSESEDDNATALDDEEAVAVQEQIRQIKAQEEEFETFNLKIVHRKNRTGFEEEKNFHVVLNSVIAGRYHVTEYLGSAAFSKAIQAHDLQTGMDVCIKIIKNNKDFFDQSLDEIKLLKYVNKHDPADKYHLLRLYDYFYYRTGGGAAAAKGSAPVGGGKRGSGQDGNGRDLHMFVWSSSASPVSDVFGGGANHHADYAAANNDLHKDVKISVPQGNSNDNQHVDREEFSFGNKDDDSKVLATDGVNNISNKSQQQAKVMPPTSVMTRLILIMVWRKLIRNPNSYSSLFGITWSLISFKWNIEMPAIIAKSISILSDAGLGMAMFSLGLFMALNPKIIACGNRKAAFAAGMRFLVGPAVMVVASYAVGLRGVLLRVAIIQAALPQGIVPFVFAKEYNVHPSILSTAVIFGMLIALPITLLYYILLGL